MTIRGNAFPGLSSWITPRSDEVQVTDSNCKIILNKKIDQVHKIAVDPTSASVSVWIKTEEEGSSARHRILTSFDNFSTTADGTNPISEVDITPFVVERAKWQTLDLHVYGSIIDTTLYKENTWYYEHASNTIELLNTTDNGGTGTSIVYSTTWRILHSAVQYYIQHGGLWYINTEENKIEKIESADGSSVRGTQTPQNLRFRVYYTPLGESVKLQVPKTNPQINQFCIPYSQQQPIVDNTTLGREMQSVANRAGCETRQVVRTIHSMEEYRSPHDHWFCRERDEQGNFTGNVWKLTAAQQTCSARA